MNWYARFKKDIKDDKGQVFFKANIGNERQTRYAIVDEDKEHLYVANVPNDLECNVVSRFKKKDQEKLFDMAEE